MKYIHFKIKVMKTSKELIRRNKIRMTKKGNYSLVGLNDNEKASLYFARKEINFDPNYMEREREDIIANYDEETNEIFFTAIKNGWERERNNVEFFWK